MSQEQQRPRRSPPPASSRVNTTVSIVVAVVAVILGFFILRDIRSGGQTNTSGADQGSAETTVAETIAPQMTTVPPIVLTAFKVQIANASKIAGSAGQLTTELQGKGYIVQPALNASVITAKQTTTVVYYLPGSEGAAAAIAGELSGVATALMPTPIPTETGKLGEASVLVLLGTDLAGKPLSMSTPTVAPAVATTTTLP